ncbi:MAG: putative Integral membrane sensor hybrid histidine kinase [Promethearchaeota archaeon]|nr:MAG: putative Integral membrane sensor hybrid histidine kinase [Candidatus Lokiarchaeota archaeon]
MENHGIKDFIETYYSLILIIAIIILVSLTNLVNFLLFHTITELFSIVIAISIFILGWHTQQYTNSQFFIRFGIGAVFVAIIDLLHTLSYEGLGIFRQYDANLPTQLWILGRYIQSSSFIIALIPFSIKKDHYYLILLYGIASIMLITSIFTGIFPDCYISGIGLTPFKIISEYIIILLLAIAILILYLEKRNYSKDLSILISLSLLSTIVSEFAFTLYINVYGFSNFIGHIFKILSFFFIYVGVIQIGLKDPMRVLFRQLKEREESLNQAYNRTNFYKNLFAHDINNIFQNILSSLELYDLEGKNIEKYHDSIKNQLIRGNKLVKNVIKLTELDEYKEELKKMSLHQALEHAISFLKESYSNKSIKIDLNLPEEPIKIQANELINDIFENILINAVKYNQNNLIKIKIKTSIITKKNQQYSKIQFIDNGIGIHPSRREEIFKTDIQKTSKTKGLGLGLSLVKKVIELYNGDLWVESRVEGEYEKGSNFVLIIPLAEEK